MRLSAPFQTSPAQKTEVLLCVVCVFSMAVACGQSLLITTVAGHAGAGSTDGTGANALLLNPQAVAFDAAGTLYVADSGNNTIRMISPGGVSSTLAGTAGVSGSADGTGGAASLRIPAGIAVDASTNIYVCDYGNSTIRLVTRTGQVTTIAGQAGVTGSANGIGTNALFFHPIGLAADSSGNLYVADYGNHLIRKISAGTHGVSTLAGMAGVFGYTNATGTNALFYEPEALVADLAGNIYVADTGNAVIRLITPAGVVTTLAGSAGILGSTDATGTNALFYQTAGIAINNNNTNLFVSDYFNNTVRRITPAQVVTTIAGLAGTMGSADGKGSVDGLGTGARFWAPQGMAVNGNGTIYVADTANSTIRAVTPGGVVTTFAGSASDGGANGTTTTARFFSPRNVAVDSSFNVYVADTLNHVIRKITPLGAVTTLAGTLGVSGSQDGPAASALFSGPQSVVVDGSGNVYVADTGNSTIREISPGGTVLTIAGSAGNPGNADGTGTAAHFSSPGGVAVDGSGSLYVADTWNHTIRKIASGGMVSTLAGLAGTFGSFDGTSSAARFNLPTGVAVDSGGNVYVSDRNNNIIRKVTPAGVVTTLAGWAGIWGSTDGTNNGALFASPSGIGVDASGNLYVADSGNQTLREVSPSGANWVVTTVAGLAGVNGSSDGTGTTAEFNFPAGIAVNGQGYVFVADSANNTVRSQGIPPMIVTQPQSQTNTVGSIVTFTVVAYGSSPLTYTWQYNNSNYPGGPSSSLMASNAGTYAVLVSNPAGSMLSSNATLTITNPLGGPGFFGNIVVGSSNTSIQLVLAGTSNALYTLQASTNLATWSNLATFIMTNGAIEYTDLTSSNLPIRFYRLISP